ncbi:MarR family transcriptional regulator [Streptomyces sp. NPDC021356]|uniref:MarR family winged helix-turn-helix transcriptional regulator n=1 Tax=Streptomyces sp. NPDC021356 TaxID=3154900 RepID=UPI003410445E
MSVTKESDLYEIVRRLWPLHRTIVRAVEREVTPFGLSAALHALLDRLRTHGPQTVPQLSRALGLDRQPVPRWVNDTAALGLTDSAPDPAHRRSRLVRLTAHGADTIDRVRAAEAAELRTAPADVTAQEVAACLRVLTRLDEEFHRLATDDTRSETPTRGTTP